MTPANAAAAPAMRGLDSSPNAPPDNLDAALTPPDAPPHPVAPDARATGNDCGPWVHDVRVLHLWICATAEPTDDTVRVLSEDQAVSCWP